MATPLSELLDAVLTDAGAREQFRLAPEAFLRSAGYRDLDAADVQEALFVLADGSEPVRAGRLLDGARSIGDPADLDGLDDRGLAGAGDGLLAAIDAATIAGTQDTTGEQHDAADRDGDDPAGDRVGDEAFGSGTGESGDVDVSDLLHLDDAQPTADAPGLSLEPEIDGLDGLGDLDDTDRPLEGVSRGADEPDDIDDEFAADDWDID
ncbi:hypothetical protein [Ilumatobacter sp.]|uniref:hypothetical protein n=1 Tax=Ilumatobacter sp. TaxID=1967498 RepID=UPI003AF6BB5F